MFNFLKKAFGFKPKPQYKPSELIEEIAEGFRSGKLYNVDIVPWGICSMATKYLDRYVIITWYSPDRFRSLSIEGDSSVFITEDAAYILQAAIERSRCYINEKFDELNQERLQK